MHRDFLQIALTSSLIAFELDTLQLPDSASRYGAESRPHKAKTGNATKQHANLHLLLIEDPRTLGPQNPRVSLGVSLGVKLAIREEIKAGADTVKSTREGFERVQGILGRYLGESFPSKKSKDNLRKTNKN